MLTTAFPSLRCYVVIREEVWLLVDAPEGNWRRQKMLGLLEPFDNLREKLVRYGYEDLLILYNAGDSLSAAGEPDSGLTGLIGLSHTLDADAVLCAGRDCETRLLGVDVALDEF